MTFITKTQWYSSMNNSILLDAGIFETILLPLQAVPKWNVSSGSYLKCKFHLVMTSIAGGNFSTFLF